MLQTFAIGALALETALHMIPILVNHNICLGLDAWVEASYCNVSAVDQLGITLALQNCRRWWG